MKWPAIDSPTVLDRLQQAVREVVVPSWIAKPSDYVGLPRAGTLKADHWRTLFAIYIPLALLSLWQEDSPIAADDANELTSVLRTSMHLTCAGLLVMKKTLQAEDPSRYRTYLRNHVLGLKESFPDIITSSHHLAFHISEGMDRFSGIRNASCFGGERLIGKLRRIPMNHKIGSFLDFVLLSNVPDLFPGEFEGTLLHSFSKGAAFRQWLLRSDCPPLMQYCRILLNRAYHSSSTSDMDLDDFPAHDKDNTAVSHGDRFADQLMGIAPIAPEIEELKEVPAPRGFYTTPNATGNSFICYRPKGLPNAEWIPAQIHGIRRENGTLRFTVRRNRTLAATSKADPFKLFWKEGFEAKMVASRLHSKSEVIEADWIVGHTVHWELGSNVTIFCKANNVRSCLFSALYDY